MPTEAKHRLLVVLGTRPEAIKLAPLVRLAKSDPRFETFVCSTGQHREMLKPVLEFFQITPDFDLDLMKPGQRLVDVLQGTLAGLDRVVASIKPSSIVVQGDTTSCLAAGLYGYYAGIDVHHVEAGLRSGDLTSPYPEEFNRRAVALTAKMHFAPTQVSADNLLREGVAGASVLVTGNTGIDALLAVRDRIQREASLRSEFEKCFQFLNPAKRLVLVTLHRRENFGEPIREVLRALKELGQRSDTQILASVHMNPQVRTAFADVLGDAAKWSQNARGSDSIVLAEPFDYTTFVYLMNRSHLILTDSGGIQEEAPALGKAVLVARTTTERAEALGGNTRLVKLSAKDIVSDVSELFDDEAAYKQMAQVRYPFGDGKACGRILDAMASQ